MGCGVMCNIVNIVMEKTETKVSSILNFSVQVAVFTGPLV